MTSDIIRYYCSLRGHPIGVIPGCEEGDYTRLPDRLGRYSWIRTTDLHTTTAAALAGGRARFVGELRRGAAK